MRCQRLDDDDDDDDDGDDGDTDGDTDGDCHGDSDGNGNGDGDGDSEVVIVLVEMLKYMTILHPFIDLGCLLAYSLPGIVFMVYTETSATHRFLTRYFPDQFSRYVDEIPKAINPEIRLRPPEVHHAWIRFNASWPFTLSSCNRDLAT